MADTVTDYEYDVFISYRSGFVDEEETIPVATRTWTREVFAPELRCWLDAEVGPSKVFVDRDEIKTGAHWPHDLAEKLNRSKLLIAVLDATYRDSTWCMAEMQSMLERERTLGLSPAGDTALVLPIHFSDGNRFPDAMKARQRQDFKKYASLTRGHIDSPVYLEMREQIRRFCQVIGTCLEHTPQWKPDWPVIRPAPSPRPHFAKPEL